MEYFRDICRGDGCGILALIVNKKYYLCEDCNYKRLHNGKTKEEVYKARKAGKIQKPIPVKPKPKVEADKADVFKSLKKQYSIPKISNKRAKVEKELNKVYSKIDHSREPVCEGCGKNGELSHSHLLSRYNRPDLITDERNIRLHCFGTYHSCHEKWERGIPEEVVEMLDFVENLDYIKSVDTQAYNAIIANMEYVGIRKFSKV
jgi:DNA-directed RNA polymerase subunit RPC12/RpoP